MCDKTVCRKGNGGLLSGAYSSVFYDANMPLGNTVRHCPLSYRH